MDKKRSERCRVPPADQLRFGRHNSADGLEPCAAECYLWDEVKGKLDQSGLSLSGGQQQRLCIARTLAFRPDIILMDEPASALDPIATLRIIELMRELAKNYTIIVVTHNMQPAARFSDRVSGRVWTDGPVVHQSKK